jgi:signal transduction histidine kinase/AmiR/NasT family two-component response regulator
MRNQPEILQCGVPAGRPPATAVYTAIGVFVGALLPLVVAAVDALLRTSSITIAAFFSAWRVNPVLWFITTAPLFLGALGIYLGRREHRIAGLYRDLELKVAERTEELTRVNQDLKQKIAQQQKAESVLRSSQEEASRVNRELERANRRLNEAVAQAQQLLTQAESASRAKSVFLGNITHEIRTPLNGIIGMAEMAMLADEETERANCLETAVACSRSLMEIIDEILDYSKLDTGEVESERVNFFLRKVVDGTMTVARNSGRGKDLEFSCHVEPDAEGEYVGDPIRLKQILANLMGNAVKFTKRGKIALHVSRAQDQPASPSPHVPRPVKLLFSVRDTGVGIPADKRRVIFDPFVQADNSHTREFTGSGLGLAVSKSLVDLMEGDIWVESEPGCGSTCSFTVTLEPAASPALDRSCGRPTAEGQRQPLRILVADDNVVSQIVVSRLLKAQGHSLMFADYGEEIVSLLDARRFDLAFIGIHLPDMTGFEAAAIVRREQTNSGIYTPLIGLVAEDEREEHRWCLKSGMDDVVFKPVEQAALYEAIGRVMSKLASDGVGAVSGDVRETETPAVSLSDNPKD